MLQLGRVGSEESVLQKARQGLESEWKMRSVFTTGQVAKICKVAPRTVSKWFDSGRLKGYRIPGSQDRRIPREQLIRFLKEHGMPLAELDDELRDKVLLFGLSVTLTASLRERLPENDGFKFETATNGFVAGIMVEETHPDCVVIDFDGIGCDTAISFCQKLRLKDGQKTIVIGLAGNSGFDHPVAPLKDWGYNEMFWKPFDAATLAEEIRRRILERKAAA